MVSESIPDTLTDQLAGGIEEQEQYVPDGSLDEIFNQDDSGEVDGVDSVPPDAEPASDTETLEGVDTESAEVSEETPQPTAREQELQRELELAQQRSDETNRRNQEYEARLAQQQRETEQQQMRAAASAEVADMRKALADQGIDDPALNPLFGRLETAMTSMLHAANTMEQDRTFNADKAKGAFLIAQKYPELSFDDVWRHDSYSAMEREAATLSRTKALEKEVADLKKEQVRARVPAQTYATGSNGARGMNDLQFLTHINGLDRELTRAEAARRDRILDNS